MLRVMAPVTPDEIERLRRELSYLSPERTPIAVKLVQRAIQQDAQAAYLTPRQVARLLQVNERTVRKWCEEGRIGACQPAGPGGAWRIPADQFPASPDAIERFLKQTRETVADAGGSMDGNER